VKDPEERVRRSAVRRVLAGAAAAEVAAELHRSERWVFKWLARYDPNDEAWARSESRARTSTRRRGTSASLCPSSIRRESATAVSMGSPASVEPKIRKTLRPTSAAMRSRHPQPVTRDRA